MGKITVELIRKRAEHNEGEIQSLEEITLHQEKIEKIELLDKVCRNLKILMLQNNSISKIENVGRLKNLEYLNLALNMVEKIENLEGCESLTKLDLTLNFIGQISSVASLRPNYFLEQLYMVGNPCHDFPGYRDYIITVLPQLKMLDGVEVTKSERIQARQNFEDIEANIILHEEAYQKEREQTRLNSLKAGGDEIVTGSEEQVKPKSSKAEVDGKDDDEEFWSQVTENTPEARIQMNRRLEKQETEKNAKKSDPGKPKIQKKLEKDGRPLNTNEPKLSFTLHDEMDRNQIVLDLAVPRFLCSSLIDADVQPNYVRVTIKGKIFQLVLPEEVRPDSSYAQRSQTTGHLVVTMPKVNDTSSLIWRGGSGQAINLTGSTAAKKKVAFPSQLGINNSKASLPPRRTGSSLGKGQSLASVPSNMFSNNFQQSISPVPPVSIPPTPRIMRNGKVGVVSKSDPPSPRRPTAVTRVGTKVGPKQKTNNNNFEKPPTSNAFSQWKLMNDIPPLI